MPNAPEVDVTLSIDLIRHLRSESRRLSVPLEWLVAGMVADTIDRGEPSGRPMALSA